MSTHTLPLNAGFHGSRAGTGAAPMLGRAWALMSQTHARRTAADLRRQAAIAGDADSAQSRELLALADAVESCKS